MTALKQPQKRIKSNLFYTCGITPKRVTSGGAHLRDLAPGQHSSEETSQRKQAMGDCVRFDRPGMELKTYGADTAVSLTTKLTTYSRK